GFPLQGVKVSHHDLRRTFGRLAHQSGMDLIQLKNLYVHSSVEMTVHYIGIDTDEMREGLNRIELDPRPRGRRSGSSTPGGGRRQAQGPLPRATEVNPVEGVSTQSGPGP